MKEVTKNLYKRDSDKQPNSMVLDGTLCRECGLVVSRFLVKAGSILRSDISPGCTRSCKACKEKEENKKNRRPCPVCGAGLIGGPGGGEECTECSYWFCY